MKEEALFVRDRKWMCACHSVSAEFTENEAPWVVIRKKITKSKRGNNQQTNKQKRSKEIWRVVHPGSESHLGTNMATKEIPTHSGIFHDRFLFRFQFQDSLADFLRENSNKLKEN